MSVVVEDKRETTNDVKGNDVSFSDLGIKPFIVSSIARINYIKATPIQEEAIPVILNNLDIVARAKNGTGKTGAYSIPILNKLDFKSRDLQALILVPTRELAMQVSRNIQQMGKEIKGFDNKVMCAVGGTDIKEDLDRIRENPLVMVGTTNRVFSFVNRHTINVNTIKMVVLDEADQLIQQDDAQNLDQIMRSLGKSQKMMFSATYPQSVENFTRKFLDDPVMINCMKNNLTLEGITQYVVPVKNEKQKVKLLNILFTKLDINQCIIFANNHHTCQTLSYVISNDLKMPCNFVSAQMEMDERNKIFHDFSQHHTRVLVATDLYTRGIDIRSVNVVINFDVPRGADSYLHRIGRCGRFGHRGLAITIIASDRDKDQFLDIDNVIKGSNDNKIYNLPRDPSTIPLELYQCSNKDLKIQ